MSLTCKCAGDFKILTSELSEGTTELREVLFCRGGRVGVKPFVTGSLIAYSSWFQPRNSLIFPIVVLFLIEG